MHQAQRVGVVGGGALGRGGEIAIRLVDDEEVGQFHHAALHTLQVIAAAGTEQQQEHVGHFRNRGFRLADTDRFHDHHLEASRLAQQQRLARAAGNAAQSLSSGARADERLFALGEFRHARLVAEDRAAGDFRRGIDSEHRDLVPAFDQILAEGFDEGGFADAGRPRYSEADRFAGLGQQLVQQLFRRQPVIFAPRFHQSDAARQSAAVAGLYLVGKILRGHFAAPAGTFGGEASTSRP
jgi:hypothetical protein